MTDTKEGEELRGRKKGGEEAPYQMFARA